MKGCNLGISPTPFFSSHCSLDPGKTAALVWQVWSKDPQFPQEVGRLAGENSTQGFVSNR